ncbi:MAG: hypothetical protein NTX82_00405 [Candidatus Parcubacteria bacterium]|nr:hypothetical protein [Candidatus Parcubacteria bacterium]
MADKGDKIWLIAVAVFSLGLSHFIFKAWGKFKKLMGFDPLENEAEIIKAKRARERMEKLVKSRNKNPALDVFLSEIDSLIRTKLTELIEKRKRLAFSIAKSAKIIRAYRKKKNLGEQQYLLDQAQEELDKFIALEDENEKQIRAILNHLDLVYPSFCSLVENFESDTEALDRLQKLTKTITILKQAQTEVNDCAVLGTGKSQVKKPPDSQPVIPSQPTKSPVPVNKSL